MARTPDYNDPHTDDPYTDDLADYGDDYGHDAPPAGLDDHLITDDRPGLGGRVGSFWSADSMANPAERWGVIAVIALLLGLVVSSNLGWSTTTGERLTVALVILAGAAIAVAIVKAIRRR